MLSKKWPGIIAMEFDSGIGKKADPSLANGKTATFMTQYDTKHSYLQWIQRIWGKGLQV